MSYEQELEKQIEEMHQKLVQSERNAFVFRKIAEYVIENANVIHNIDLDTKEPTGGFFVKSEFNVRKVDLQTAAEYIEAKRFFDTLHAKAVMPVGEDSVPF